MPEGVKHPFVLAQFSVLSSSSPLHLPQRLTRRRRVQPLEAVDQMAAAGSLSDSSSGTGRSTRRSI